MSSLILSEECRLKVFENEVKVRVQYCLYRPGQVVKIPGG